MNVSGYDSNSISTLFSSLGSSATSGVGALSMMVSDYNSIKSGAYGKLLRSYYDMNTSSDVKSKAEDIVKEKTADKSTSEKSKTTETKKEAYRMASDATELSDNTAAMMDKRLYEMKEVKGADGKTTKEYDIDNIISATKNFISSFNSMIEDGEDSSITGVARNTEALKTDAKMNKSALSGIGISVKADGSLKLDEDKLRSADMTKVSDIFRGSGGFGMRVSQEASMIEYQSKAAQASGYNSQGRYNSDSAAYSFSDYV